MAVELMLNAVNLILVTADTTVRAALPHTGAGLRAVRDRAGRRRDRRGPGDRAPALPAARQRRGRRGAADRAPSEPADAVRRPRRRSAAGHGGSEADRVTGTLGAALPLVPLAVGPARLPAAAARPGARRRPSLGIAGAAGALAGRGRARRHGRRAGRDQSATWVDFGGLTVTFGVRLDAAAALRRGRGRRGRPGRAGLLDRPTCADDDRYAAVRRPGQPLHRRDAAGGRRRRPDHAAGRLGGHGHLLVPADRPRPHGCPRRRPPR